MPTYQYRCSDCGSELEVVQKFTDPSLTECNVCDGTLRKVYNPVGVVFKGSGFYATDNRTKGKQAAAAPASSSSDSNAGSGSSTSSTTSAAKESSSTSSTKSTSGAAAAS